jgi:hypothetical protein
MKSVPSDLAQDFLAKPFLPATIEKRIQAMLARDPASSGHGKFGAERNTEA